MAHRAPSLALGDGVVRAASFAARPPSPPSLQIPSAFMEFKHPSLELTPSFESVDTGSLTAQDIEIITGGRSQSADTVASRWVYENRRRAQPVLDFLYLGPFPVVRDREFLRREGITLLLAARDASMAEIQMMSVEKVKAELGIEAAYIDVATRSDLIRSFPAAVTTINDHLLRVYKSQAQGQTPDGQMMINKDTFRRGKVLVFCETGNERSAAIVAAYLMAMYARNMVSAVQFVSAQRFCVNIDDDSRYQLRSFEDILLAQRMTARATGPSHPASAGPANGAAGQANPTTISASNRKRGIGDTMDLDDDGDMAMDQDRYENRAAFVPYVQEETMRLAE